MTVAVNRGMAGSSLTDFYYLARMILVKNETDFDKSKIYVVKTFNDALNELKSKCDKDTVVIFLNDLPDTYAK